MRTQLLFKGGTGFLPLMLLVCVQSGSADSLSFTSDDTIIITAERGWEGDEADVIHFSGDFELHAPDWSMAGDTAVVYGKLDDPDRVEVEGSPARISFLREQGENPGKADEQEEVTGAANFVEYFRATDQLIMRGDANLVHKDSTLTSQKIEYNADTDRYSASGEGGINIQFNPDDE